MRPVAPINEMRSLPPRAPAAMEIGGVVTFRGRPWYVRGLDPHGVTPQYVYLENAHTGRRIAVLRERLTGPGCSREEPSRLHLVDPDAMGPE